jgi:hypothetical protein
MYLHQSHYFDNTTQVGFVTTLLSNNTFSWFAPLKEKNLLLLNNLNTFLEALSSTFGDTNQKNVIEINIQSLQQRLCSITTHVINFQQLIYNFE